MYKIIAGILVVFILVIFSFIGYSAHLGKTLENHVKALVTKANEQGLDLSMKYQRGWRSSSAIIYLGFNSAIPEQLSFKEIQLDIQHGPVFKQRGNWIFAKAGMMVKLLNGTDDGVIDLIIKEIDVIAFNGRVDYSLKELLSPPGIDSNLLTELLSIDAYNKHATAAESKLRLQFRGSYVKSEMQLEQLLTLKLTDATLIKLNGFLDLRRNKDCTDEICRNDPIITVRVKLDPEQHASIVLPQVIIDKPEIDFNFKGPLSVLSSIFHDFPNNNMLAHQWSFKFHAKKFTPYNPKQYEERIPINELNFATSVVFDEQKQIDLTSRLSHSGMHYVIPRASSDGFTWDKLNMEMKYKGSVEWLKQPLIAVNAVIATESLPFDGFNIDIDAAPIVIMDQGQEILSIDGYQLDFAADNGNQRVSFRQKLENLNVDYQPKDDHVKIENLHVEHDLSLSIPGLVRAVIKQDFANLPLDIDLKHKFNLIHFLDKRYSEIKKLTLNKSQLNYMRKINDKSIEETRIQINIPSIHIVNDSQYDQEFFQIDIEKFIIDGETERKINQLLPLGHLKIEIGQLQGAMRYGDLKTQRVVVDNYHASSRLIENKAKSLSEIINIRFDSISAEDERLGPMSLMLRFDDINDDKVKQFIHSLQQLSENQGISPEHVFAIISETMSGIKITMISRGSVAEGDFDIAARLNILDSPDLATQGVLGNYDGYLSSTLSRAVMKKLVANSPYPYLLINADKLEISDIRNNNYRWSLRLNKGDVTINGKPLFPLISNLLTSPKHEMQQPDVEKQDNMNLSQWQIKYGCSAGDTHANTQNDGVRGPWCYSENIVESLDALSACHGVGEVRAQCQYSQPKKVNARTLEIYCRPDLTFQITDSGYYCQ